MGRQQRPKKLGLGDLVESALSAVGITEERVSALIGKDCGCKQRKEWLNRVRLWARYTKTATDPSEAVKHFEDMEKEKGEEKK